MEEISDSIIRRCKAGDKDAFRVVVTAYQQMVFSLTMKMLCDEDEAKDATQETFIRVWLSIKQYSTDKKFSTWIYTIASRYCIDRLKKLKHQSLLPDDESVLVDYMTETSPQRQLENYEWISIVKVLVQGLSERQRLVFTLSNLEGLESTEIEAISGLDAKQVKSNLYVARQTIREQLKRLGYE